MFNNQAVAMRIRSIRISKNYTQLYMSTKLQVSQNCYSKLELGQTKISLERLFEIADLLDVDPIKIAEAGKHAMLVF